jgi:hypothetical protein
VKERTSEISEAREEGEHFVAVAKQGAAIPKKKIKRT